MEPMIPTLFYELPATIVFLYRKAVIQGLIPGLDQQPVIIMPAYDRCVRGMQLRERSLDGVKRNPG